MRVETVLQQYFKGECQTSSSGLYYNSKLSFLLKAFGDCTVSLHLADILEQEFNQLTRVAKVQRIVYFVSTLTDTE